jgi:hypothetical protein
MISTALLGEFLKTSLVNVPQLFALVLLESVLQALLLTQTVLLVKNVNKLVLLEMHAILQQPLVLRMVTETFCAIVLQPLVMMVPSAPKILATSTPEFVSIHLLKAMFA